MNDRIYRFDKFELFSDEGELRSSDSSLQLQDKPLRLLTVLVQNPQRMVTRDQLRKRMWDSETFVDYDQGINVAMKKVREALGDSAENPKFIQTVAKKGYRFLVPVAVIYSDPITPTVPAPQPVANGPAIPNATVGSRHSVRLRWIFAIFAASALSVLAFWLVKVQTHNHHLAQIHSLAVLPLRNLSPDSGQEYFADGVTEELITSLAQSLPLRVISRTSVMRYKQTTEPITQIARELGVEAIVEGSVASSGNRVTVTVQLIDATEDRHLWAQQYDRKLGDLLGMEAELCRQIAQQVGGTLISQQEIKAAKLRRVDPRVHELYLKGRYFWNKRTDEGMMRAAEYFRQAVDLDPDYAQAYVGLADCYMFGQPPLPLNAVLFNTREMARRALALDDGLGEAHATLGLLAENDEWDWAEAEKEYKRAIELNPNYATAHQWYGEELALTGRFDEALEQLKLANNLDPLSLIIIKDTGEIYYVARRYDKAIEYFRKVLEMDPSFVVARLYLGLAYVQKREFRLAITEFKETETSQHSPDALSGLGYAYALSGRRRAAQEILNELSVMSERRHVDPSYYAAVYAGLGDKDNALEWLERAYREHALLTGLKVDPQWDILRTDPRFTDLMKRVGLPS
jgi:TolB-like protein/DNA-binding winged helix-turn-helix (wHTH) protein/Flp pilus assembly protein TadD